MKYVFLLSFIYAFQTSFSQLPHCGTDHEVNKSIQQNPHLQEKLDELERFTENFTPNRAGTYIIPVVVHVIHNNGTGNIPIEQVEKAIEIMNEDFNKLNADTSEVISAFQSIVADMNIEFRLAKLDPQGNCTNGVTKTVSELTYNGNEDVKDLISWNTYKYFNIWVVNNIESGAGAYAYYPGTAPQQSHEGVLCRNSQFGDEGVSSGSNFSRRTMTHETGHYFNLRHTWGNTNDVALTENCFSDDQVDDTPNTKGTSQSCNLNQYTCGSLDNIQNYMDYSTCTKMFTNGQKSRVEAALNSSNGGRSYLWQESNLWDTGTHDDYVASSCQPIPDFYTDFTEVCQGDVVTFHNTSYNGTVNDTWTYLWEFEDGVPATSTEINPEVSFSSSGQKTITLTATNSGGEGTTIKSDFINIKALTGGEVYPFSEGFENESFPSHPTDPIKDWVVESSDSPTWSRNTSAFIEGDASMAVRLRNTTEGSTHELISPPIDFSETTTSSYLNFSYAYAKRNDDSNDQLKVQISTNCGKSWLTRLSITGSDLSTNGDNNVSSGSFIPNTSEWAEKTVNLGPVIGKEGILIRFLITSQQGNYFYLDKVNLLGVEDGIEDMMAIQSITVRPTYGNQFPTIVNNNEDLKEITIEIYDVLGKQVFALSSDNQTIDLSQFMGQVSTKGVFIIRVRNQNAERSFKFFKI